MKYEEARWVEIGKTENIDCPKRIRQRAFVKKELKRKEASGSAFNKGRLSQEPLHIRAERECPHKRSTYCMR